MCGIAGYFDFDGRPADVRTVKRMIDIQRHRGPDDQGLRLFSLVHGTSVEPTSGSVQNNDLFEGALGFNRLSILDLTAHGHQPMANLDGTVMLAFNGEVYNAFDYRDELENYGFRFRSRTDTEIILYLYEQFGLDGMLARLNGMFAIVIADLRRREIHIVRDHLGIKPMYWTVAGSTLMFASEVKSFLVHPAFHAELDPEHIDQYLGFRYVCGEDFLLKGVKQLRPGHHLRVTPEGFAVRRYWEIPDGHEKSSISNGEAVNRLRHILENAVKSQLLSDVRVGSQLSGGIDSTLVSLFAQAHLDRDLETFSVVFDDPQYSEEKWISEASDVLQTESHRFVFTDQFFFDTLDRATWHLDQPITHPNSLGIWLVAEKSRPRVTVLLSGEGADEVFAGYTRFYYAHLRPKLSPWLPLLKRAPKVGARLERQFGGTAAGSFIAASLFQRPDQMLQVRPEMDFESVMLRRRQMFDEGKADHLNNCLKYDAQTYLPDLLVRQDKMTMAHSLENRVPFLDLNVVSFARTLPASCLVSDRIAIRNTRMRGTKVVLKELARRTFDSRFVYRPKSGFSLPLARYLRDRRFETLMEERLLPGMGRRGLVQPDVVRRWWRSSPLTPGLSETIWISVALELWAQNFLDSKPAVERRWPAATVSEGKAACALPV